MIETGTYRGTTTERLRRVTNAPIVTIELSSRYFEYARRRLSGMANVRIVHGDSPTEIRHIAVSIDHDRGAKVFAYLDAHWGRNLPTRWEILELLAGWDSLCIVIDDFKVPGDLGYAFDDYGRGFALDLDLLSGLPLEDVAAFYPGIPSGEESGHRRGWVVLGRGQDIVRELERADGLTPMALPARLRSAGPERLDRTPQSRALPGVEDQTRVRR